MGTQAVMEAGRDPPRNPRPSILIVAGDTAVRELLAEILIDSGLDVLAAADGNEALEYARRRRIDLVIADLAVPEPEGMETVSRLLGEQPEIKVIAISGYQRAAYRDHAASAGIVATIRKPFSIEIVLGAVASVLASRKAVAQISSS